jgi:hypothetical protein
MVRTTLELQKETLNRLREAGRKSQTYDKLINERITCNASGCHAEGKIELKLKAGNDGFVTLFVCEKCVRKFAFANNTNNENENENKKISPSQAGNARHLDRLSGEITDDSKGDLLSNE